MNPDRGGYLYSNRAGDDGDPADPTADPTRPESMITRPAAPAPGPLARVRNADSDDWNDMFVRDSGGVDSSQVPVRREDNRPHMPEECTKECLPPPADHEIEFIVKDALNYPAGMPTRSAAKTVGNFRFKILVFPSGTQSTGGLQVSAFVEADPVEGLDPRWVFHGVKYQVCVINWLDYRRSVNKTDTWTFSKDGIDRGWHDMMRTSELSPETGWLGPDNSLCLRASCYVRQADGINVNSDYNFKKETGYIGLKNHGATCYMNGLLQSLFHVGEFRRIVYSIDCDDNPDCPGKDDPAPELSKLGNEDGEGKAPPLIQALQNVFYKLQTADQAVNCRELMKSFGWDTMDAFTQHDAQELNRILCDRLEEQMKGSPMDGSIKRLFEGEMENYIECIDVDYKSKRNETFYDIQLNIKGERGQELRNIEESFRDFTAEETLEGDNAYEAEGHGKQRAKKGIRFLAFPPVLNLQLKRFHFDLEKMDMVKLNSRFEFHRKLDLSAFAPKAGVYLLYAVVVHHGDVNSGHYYAHIRPNFEHGWFKFDDDTVTPCSDYAAVEDNYGGNDLAVWNYFDRSPRALNHSQPPTRPRIHNAYMLVYIREDLAAQVLAPPDPKVTNPRMVERCDREVRMAEQRRREKMEQQLKIKIKLVFDRDLRKMAGFWYHEDVPHEMSLKMGRDQLVKDLAAEVETLVEVPKQNIALFCLAYRNNPRQVRFSFMPPNSVFRSFIPQFNAPHFDTSDPYLVVLCVIPHGYDVQSLKWRPAKEDAKPDELARWHDEQVILLIVKYFCPQNHKIVTLGSYYLITNDPLITMVADGWIQGRLKTFANNKEIAPLPEDPESFTWECWEEFSDRDIQARNVNRMIKHEQLWSGDVVIWQPVRVGNTVVTNSNAAGEVQPSRPAVNDSVEGCDSPMYPLNNVSDYAAHLSNSTDVVVTLHDCRQPLCIDGMVSNGNWGTSRPQSATAKETKKGDPSPVKEERPEDAALALSPVSFNWPQERETKMDLRWHLHHVTGTIAQAFGLKPEAGDTALWLFHTTPSSTCEEPLNVYNAPMRNEPITLKELQRNATYLTTAAKRPLCLHAVQVPLPPGNQIFDRGLAPLCIRFYDDAVREVGSHVIAIPGSGTVEDILMEAKKHLQPSWGITGPLRLLEVVDSRLHKLHKPDTAVRSLACVSKLNVFFHCLRVEANSDISGVNEGCKLIEIFHCDRQSQQAFAQPLLMNAAPGEKAGSLKARCKAKLQVQDAEFKSWRLVRSARTGKTHLKDDEAWDSDLSTEAKLCLEHVHPNPTTLAQQSRYKKPLTIKG